MRLLFKNEESHKSNVNNLKEVFNDLEFDRIINLINFIPSITIKEEELYEVLSYDKKVILYRQELFKNFLENGEFFDEMIDIFPLFYELKKYFSYTQNQNKFHINKMMNNVNEIDQFYKVISRLNNILGKHKSGFTHEGLKQFAIEVNKIYDEENSEDKIQNLKILKESIIKPNSCVLGLNLDDMLYPESACLLNLSEYYFYPKTIIKASKANYGIGKFKWKSVNNFPYKNPHLNKVQKWQAKEENVYIESLDTLNSNLLIPNNKTAVKYITERIINLEYIFDDLKIVLCFTSFFKKLKEKGMVCCLPNIVDIEKREFVVESIYNPLLAYNQKEENTNIITNSIDYNSKMRSVFLTGPNKGGKTTFCQAIGLNLIFAHIGTYMTCEAARISLSDQILTHYQKEEENMDKEGRLEFEMKNFKKIFEVATKNSFVLINEPFASTSPSEGEHLSMQILLGLKIISCRTLMVSHFYRMIKYIEKYNKEFRNECVLKALSMGIENENGKNIRTYKITEKVSDKSFAMDIVQEYCKSLLT